MLVFVACCCFGFLGDIDVLGFFVRFGSEWVLVCLVVGYLCLVGGLVGGWFMGEVVAVCVLGVGWVGLWCCGLWCWWGSVWFCCLALLIRGCLIVSALRVRRGV